MTKEELTKDIHRRSAAIATFMGYTYYPFNEEEKGLRYGWIRSDNRRDTKVFVSQNPFLSRTTKDLKYRNSWDWLMPVVQKIMKDQLLTYNITVALTQANIGILFNTVSDVCLLYNIDKS